MKLLIKYRSKAVLYVGFILLGPGYAMASTDPVTLLFETATTNASLVSNQSTELNETMGFSQNIFKYMYYTLKATFAQHQKLGAELDIGVQTKIGRYIPFVELETTNQSMFSQNLLAVDYDVGLAYQLTNKLSPVVVLDGLGIKGNNVLIYGMQYTFNSHVSSAIEGMKVLSGMGSGAKLKISYTI